MYEYSSNVSSPSKKGENNKQPITFGKHEKQAYYRKLTKNKTSFFLSKKMKKQIELAKFIVRSQSLIIEDELIYLDESLVSKSYILDQYPCFYNKLLMYELPFKDLANCAIKEICLGYIERIFLGINPIIHNLNRAFSDIPHWDLNVVFYFIELCEFFDYKNKFKNYEEICLIISKISVTNPLDMKLETLLLSINKCMASSRPLTTKEPVVSQGFIPAIGLDEDTKSIMSSLIDTIQGSLIYDPDGSKITRSSERVVEAAVSHDRISPLLTTFMETLTSVQKTTSDWTFSNMTTSARNMLGNLGENYLKQFLPIIIFALIAYFYYTGRISTTVFITIVGMLVAFLGIEDLQKTIKSVFQKAQDLVRPQSFSMLCPSLFTTIAGLFVSGSMFGTINYDKFFKEFPHAMKDFKRMKTGVADFMTFIVETISDCIAWVCSKCSVKDYLQLKTVGTYETWEWIRECEDIKTYYNSTKSALDWIFALQVRDLVKDGEKLLAMHNKKEDEHYKLILYHLNTLKPIVEMCRGCHLYGDGFRPEPVSIMIGGEPGIGKSTLFPILCTHIGMKIVPEEKLDFYTKNPDKLFYNRITENVYWDGYIGQPVCLFEDFAQYIDSVGATNSQFWEFIRAKNCAPYNLHMSAISDKASTPFVSQVIVCTTNCNKFQKDAEIKSILSDKAFTRRIDVGLKCVVSQQYSIDNVTNPSERKANLSKIASMEFDPHFKHLEFYEHDYSTGITDWSNKKSFIEVINFCDNYYKRKLGYFSVNQSALKDIARSIALGRSKNQITVLEGGLDQEKITWNEWIEENFDVLKKKYNLENVFKKHKTLSTEQSADSVLKDVLKTAIERKYNIRTTTVIDSDQDEIIEEIIDNTVQSESSRSLNCTIENELRNLDLVTILRMYERDVDAHKKFASVIEASFNALETELTPQEILDIFFNFHHNLIGDSDIMHDMEIMKFYNLMAGDPRLLALIPLKPGHTHDEVEISLVAIKILCFVHCFHLKVLGFIKPKSPMTIQFLDTIDKIKQSLKEKKALWITLGSILGVIGAGFMVYKMWPESTTEQSSKPNKPRKKVNKVQRRVISHAGDPQGSAIVESVFEKNLILYLVKQKDGKVYKYGNFLGLTGNVMIGPKHFVNDLVDEDDVVILKPWNSIGTNYQIEVPYEEFCRYQTVLDDSEDFAFYCIPHKIFPRYFRDMLKFFVSREQANKMIEKKFQSGSLSVPKYDGDTKAIMYVQDIKIKYLADGKSVDPSTAKDYWAMANGEWNPQKLLSALTYEAETKTGFCGGIVSIKDKSSTTSKIWGIHTMGTSEQGYAKPLTREFLNESLEKVKNYFDEYEPDSLYAYRPSLFKDEEKCPLPSKPEGVPHFEVQGFEINDVLHKSEYLPKKTNLIKSPAYDVLAATGHEFKKHIPDLQKCPRGGKDILHYSRYKYNQKVRPYDQKLLDKINASYYQYILSCQSGEDRSPRVLTFEEAVEGFPGDDSFNSISKSAKPGWPWKYKGYTGTKKQMFGEYEFDFSLPGAIEIRKRYHEILDMYKKGVRPYCVAKAFPKDERRPLGKHLRYVSGYEVTLCLLFRSYFGDFCRMLYRTRLYGGVSIGINPYSTDWDFLLKKHKEKNQHFFGDFSNWDGSQTRQLMWCFLDAANWYYNDGNNKIREMLFEEIFNPKHVYKNTIYSLFTGNSAGHPITPYLNSYSNVVLTKYTIHSVIKDKDPHYDFKTVEQHNHSTAFGDDGIISIDSCLGILPIDLQRKLAEYGWTFTDENKDTTMTIWKEMEDGTFLQRGFYFHPVLQRYTAPLNINTIMEMSCFTKSEDQSYEFVRANIDKAYLELSLHPRETFNKFSPILRDMGFAIQHSSDCVSYKELSVKASALTEDGFLH